MRQLALTATVRGAIGDKVPPIANFGSPSSNRQNYEQLEPTQTDEYPPPRYLFIAQSVYYGSIVFRILCHRAVHE